MTESPGAVIAEALAQRDRAMARVRELEAELAKYRSPLENPLELVLSETYIRALANRAEKAEAEVERLRPLLERACACWAAWQKYALGLQDGRINIRPELEATIEKIYRKYGAPGGGRESDTSPPPRSSVSVWGPVPPAANPAAPSVSPSPLHPHNGLWEDCPECNPAVRKERDECGDHEHTVVHEDGEVCPLRYALPNVNEKEGA